MNAKEAKAECEKLGIDLTPYKEGWSGERVFRDVNVCSLTLAVSFAATRLTITGSVGAGVGGFILAYIISFIIIGVIVCGISTKLLDPESELKRHQYEAQRDKKMRTIEPSMQPLTPVWPWVAGLKHTIQDRRKGTT